MDTEILDVELLRFNYERQLSETQNEMILLRKQADVNWKFTERVVAENEKLRKRITQLETMFHNGNGFTNTSNEKIHWQPYAEQQKRANG